MQWRMQLCNEEWIAVLSQGCTFYLVIYLSKKEFIIIHGWPRSEKAVKKSSISRIRLNAAKLAGLEDAGWTIITSESEKRVDYSFIDSEGHKFKSAKDVERNLKCDGLLHPFLKKESVEVSCPNTALSMSKDCSNESNENFEPPPEKKKKDLLKVSCSLGEL